MYSNSYLLSLPAFNGKTASTILTSALASSDAKVLRNLAVKDALGVWYSGALSLAQGVNGVHSKRYAWSTVKLYYSAYYFLRSILLAHGWCQFYIDGKPRLIEARPGQMPVKQAGTSHESCYRIFEKVFPKSSLISQPIGLFSAAEWMKKQREEINYNTPRFPDPEVPTWFEEHALLGVRRAVIEYLHDPLAYEFIDRHAMIAYPLAAGIEAVVSLRASGIATTEDEKKGFVGYWRDSTGQLPGIDRFFE